jgi:bacteriocin biosynthesis cyclodehydratase domain-containing protein
MRNAKIDLGTILREGRSRRAQDCSRWEDAHVLVIGDGGVGSRVIDITTQEGLGSRGSFVIVDHDSLELSDLTRHAQGGINDLGRKKVHITRRCVKKKTGSTIVAIAKSIHEPDVQQQISKPWNLIVDTTDNNRAHLATTLLSIRTASPLIIAGAGINSRTHEAGSNVLLSIPHQGCACCAGTLDLEAADVERRTDDLRRHGYDVAAPSAEAMPVVAHMTALSAAVAAGLAFNLLRDPRRMTSSMLSFFDWNTLTARTVPFTRDHQNCPLCGDSTLAPEEAVPRPHDQLRRRAGRNDP